MAKTNLKEVSAIQLVETLQKIERCNVVLNPHGPSPFGFDLYFVPLTTCTSNISNIYFIVDWADVHRYTTSVGYDNVEEAIVVRLRRLLPDSEYSEEEII